MKIEISNGELLDKISILELKLLKIKDKAKLVNIQKEMDNFGILKTLFAIVNVKKTLVKTLLN
jgi:hypothetical protein